MSNWTEGLFSDSRATRSLHYCSAPFRQDLLLLVVVARLQVEVALSDHWNTSIFPLTELPVPISPGTTIALNTVRIEATGPTGPASYGTGYFYKFGNTSVGEVAVIITNKHVVVGRTEAKFVLQLMRKDSQICEDGTADGEYSTTVTIDDLSQWVVLHPDADVDLCAILMIPIVPLLPEGFTLKHSFAQRDWHVPDAELGWLRPVEPIIMIGYPNGLWDSVNNRPLTRQGLTASHPLLKWNGQRYFVIDAACFPGSSGSPVYLFEDRIKRVGANDYDVGTRARLLGTLWGGPVVTTEGRMEVRAIPTSVESVPVVNLMMNLGYVVHASAIDDLAQWLAVRVTNIAATARARSSAAFVHPSYSGLLGPTP